MMLCAVNVPVFLLQDFIVVSMQFVIMLRSSERVVSASGV
jgi:hypothetical protein